MTQLIDLATYVACAGDTRDLATILDDCAVVSAVESHHEHHHATRDDDGCAAADVLVTVEHDASRSVWLWSGADGEMRYIEDGIIRDCDEREALDAGEPQLVREGDAIGWRLDRDVDPADLDWETVLQYVADLAERELDALGHAAWRRACAAGRGPDADADTAGVRWVVRADEMPDSVEVTRAR